ncbi:MAG: class I SAM-dependent methyltransferase [Rubrivivax sp.]
MLCAPDARVEVGQAAERDAPAAAMPQAACRLCGGALAPRFRLQVLRRHDVAYLECVRCASLQTERPYWLDEAYAPGAAALDVGALQRNLENFAYCLTFARLFGVRSAVDYGGGDGLLCRFLRDHGVDAYTWDKYAASSFARGFERPSCRSPDLLTAFEVLEHLADPAAELEPIFACQPRYLVCTTEPYAQQGPEWWYLAPLGGQHVFFYSPQALVALGERFGYCVAQVGAKLVYVRNDLGEEAMRRLTLAKEVLSGWIFQAIRGHVFTQPAPGVASDFARVSRGS